jgi:hypothetical protein
MIGEPVDIVFRVSPGVSVGRMDLWICADVGMAMVQCAPYDDSGGEILVRIQWMNRQLRLRAALGD